MRELIVKSELYSFDTFDEFVREFQVGSEDMIITNEFILANYEKKDSLKASVIYQERYGQGEPSDVMFEAMYKDISALPPCRRIIGIGGGTVLDISKLFALRYSHPVEKLYSRELPVEKDKELILIPTTCGTGSEMTNISILALIEKQTKMGLAMDELYADKAVLIPEFLEKLPFRFFATSSIDALIHAVESSLSSKATVYTRMFGYQAMEMILRGYQKIAAEGEEARIPLLKEFLIASNYAGIAFGTAGCGPVHALSYPLSGTFHVAHGEANYAIFNGVMNRYLREGSQKAIGDLQVRLASVLGCRQGDAFEELDVLLSHVIEKKSLREYGANPKMLADWSRSVPDTQQRLMRHSPIPLTCEEILEIYNSLY